MNMTVPKYDTWIDLKPTNITNVTAIAKLNLEFNTNTSLRQQWSTIYNDIFSKLKENNLEDLPESTWDIFEDTEYINELESSWDELVEKLSPFEVLSKDSFALYRQEQSGYAQYVYTTLITDYGLSDELCSTILTNAGPSLALYITSWLIEVGDILKSRELTPVEIFDAIYLLVNAQNNNKMGVSRHLQLFTAFDLPTIPHFNKTSFYKGLSIVEPLAAFFFRKLPIISERFQKPRCYNNKNNH